MSCDYQVARLLGEEDYTSIPVLLHCQEIPFFENLLSNAIKVNRILSEDAKLDIFMEML
jgi:hypothetical protein